MIVRRLARRVAGASVAPFVAGVGVVAAGPPLIEATAHSLACRGGCNSGSGTACSSTRPESARPSCAHDGRCSAESIAVVRAADQNRHAGRGAHQRRFRSRKALSREIASDRRLSGLERRRLGPGDCAVEFELTEGAQLYLLNSEGLRAQSFRSRSTANVYLPRGAGGDGNCVRTLRLCPLAGEARRVRYE